MKSAGWLDDNIRYLDDLHAFDPATMTWNLLSVADDAGRPSARSSHGFTSAGGLLYVHGGSCWEGDSEAMASRAGDFNQASMYAVGATTYMVRQRFRKLLISVVRYHKKKFFY